MGKNNDDFEIFEVPGKMKIKGGKSKIHKMVELDTKFNNE